MAGRRRHHRRPARHRHLLVSGADDRDLPRPDRRRRPDNRRGPFARNRLFTGCWRRQRHAPSLHPEAATRHQHRRRLAGIGSRRGPGARQKGPNRLTTQPGWIMFRSWRAAVERSVDYSPLAEGRHDEVDGFLGSRGSSSAVSPETSIDSSPPDSAIASIA